MIRFSFNDSFAFPCEKLPSGNFAIRRVPVLPAVGDRAQGLPITPEWLQAAMHKLIYRRDKEGYLPRVHIEHLGDLPFPNPDAGFMDNPVIDDMYIDGELLPTLFVDCVEVPEEVVRMVEQYRLPYRSVEIHPRAATTPEVSSLALLRTFPPFFKLPMTTIRRTGEGAYTFSDKYDPNNKNIRRAIAKGTSGVDDSGKAFSDADPKGGTRARVRNALDAVEASKDPSPYLKDFGKKRRKRVTTDSQGSKEREEHYNDQGSHPRADIDKGPRKDFLKQQVRDARLSSKRDQGPKGTAVGPPRWDKAIKSLKSKGFNDAGDKVGDDEKDDDEAGDDDEKKDFNFGGPPGMPGPGGPPGAPPGPPSGGDPMQQIMQKLDQILAKMGGGGAPGGGPAPGPGAGPVQGRLPFKEDHGQLKQFAELQGRIDQLEAERALDRDVQILSDAIARFERKNLVFSEQKLLQQVKDLDLTGDSLEKYLEYYEEGRVTAPGPRGFAGAPAATPQVFDGDSDLKQFKDQPVEFREVAVSAAKEWDANVGTMKKYFPHGRGAYIEAAVSGARRAASA